MKTPAKSTARGLIDLLGLVPNAARVAAAVENGNTPSHSDLRALGLEDIFNRKP